MSRPSAIPTDHIDPTKILSRFSWIATPNQNAVLSPDSDGFLCGLFMSKFLGWKIVGFYDGKVLLIKRDVSASNAIFLDMEVYRPSIRSVGQHMLMYHKNHVPRPWAHHLQHCMNPNELRGFDVVHDFQAKYPLATIHWLMGLLGPRVGLTIPDSAIAPLLFTDGTYMNLFGYTENVLNWIRYLGADIENHSLHRLFCDQRLTVPGVMNMMVEFFRKRNEISAPKERGDRLKVSRNKDGVATNVVRDAQGVYSIAANARGRAVRFIGLLGELTGWHYQATDWTWDGLVLHQFSKGELGASKKTRLNLAHYGKTMRGEPLSFAFTAGNRMEYTKGHPARLPL